MRLIDADALKKALTSDTRNIYVFECLSRVLETIDNAPTVESVVNCSHCDYFKFSRAFIENIVKFMTDYNIESVEGLMKELNHINELLGGRQ